MNILSASLFISATIFVAALHLQPTGNNSLGLSITAAVAVFAAFVATVIEVLEVMEKRKDKNKE